MISPLNWRRTSDIITLILFFQLSSLETKAQPTICIQQPIRCPCGLSQTNQCTAEGSVQTLPLVLVWAFQVGGMSSDDMKVHLFLIHIQSDLISLLCTAPCADDQFQCHTGSCINSKHQCNGVVDCPDASDETDCGKLSISNL